MLVQISFNRTSGSLCTLSDAIGVGESAYGEGDHLDGFGSRPEDVQLRGVAGQEDRVQEVRQKPTRKHSMLWVKLLGGSRRREKGGVGGAAGTKKYTCNIW